MFIVTGDLQISYYSENIVQSRFLAFFSNVFLLKGPSMVTTPMELPSVQLQAPVGL